MKAVKLDWLRENNCTVFMYKTMPSGEGEGVIAVPLDFIPTINTDDWKKRLIEYIESCDDPMYTKGGIIDLIKNFE